MNPLLASLITIVENLALNPNVGTLVTDLFTSKGITQADLDVIVAQLPVVNPPNTEA